MLTSCNNKNIKISLPYFYKFDFLNELFISLQENKKHIFNDNFEITSVEGCFPSSIWSLDRIQRYSSKSEIEYILNYYSEHNISVIYDFNNDCLTKDDLSDNFSNLILKSGHKEGNGVFVKSNLLYKYIKRNFPLYKLIKYATPKDFDKNNIAIIDKYNNSFNKNEIKYKNNAYITLNPLCSSECKHYDEHRIFWGYERKNFSDVKNITFCYLKKNSYICDLIKNPNFISVEMMKEYIDNGFEHFRIYYPSFANSIGIIYNIFNVVENYLYYLIKPEYQQEIRLKALKIIENNQKERKE